MPESPNPPKKHHYIPSFYLRRWTKDGVLVHYERVHDKIVSKSRAPDGSGYKDYLYTIPHFDPHQAQIIESGVLAKIDDDGAEVMHLIDKGQEARISSNSELASKWALFAGTLSYRTPKVITQLIDDVRRRINPKSPAMQAFRNIRFAGQASYTRGGLVKPNVSIISSKV